MTGRPYIEHQGCYALDDIAQVCRDAMRANVNNDDLYFALHRAAESLHALADDPSLLIVAQP